MKLNKNTPYNAEKQLAKLKKQSNAMQDLLFLNKHEDYASINIKLRNCSMSSIIDTTKNRIDQQRQSCGLLFCPICASTQRINREVAIAYRVIDKIIAKNLGSGKKSKPVLKLLTLTVPKVLPHELEASFKKLKQDFKMLLNTKMTKKSGKIVSFNDSLLGCSVYYHLSVSNDCHGYPTVGVHLHAVLLLRPSFSGADAITGIMIKDYWMIVTGLHDSLETNIKSIQATSTDFKNTNRYGLNRFNFDDIIANPRKFIEILPYIQGKHFCSHSGVLRTYRNKVRAEYAEEQRIEKKAKTLLEIEARKDAYVVVSNS